MVWAAALHLVQQHCILIPRWGTSITLSLTRISSTEFLVWFTAAPKTWMEQFGPATRQLYQASQTRCHAHYFIVFIIQLIFAEKEVPHLLSRGQKEKRYWEEKSQDGAGFFITTHSIATPSCPIQIVSNRPRQVCVYGTSTPRLSLGKDNRGHLPAQLRGSWQSHRDLASEPNTQGKRTLNLIWGETSTSRGFPAQRAPVLRSYFNKGADKVKKKKKIVCLMLRGLPACSWCAIPKCFPTFFLADELPPKLVVLFLWAVLFKKKCSLFY